jgi:hypothetical protein
MAKRARPGRCRSSRPRISSWRLARLKGGRVHTGKVCEVLYDCFGDFDGFVLEACCTERHVFRNGQARIGRVVLHACEKRLTVSVWLDATGGTICKVVIHG